MLGTSLLLVSNMADTTPDYIQQRVVPNMTVAKPDYMLPHITAMASLPTVPCVSILPTLPSSSCFPPPTQTSSLRSGV